MTSNRGQIVSIARGKSMRSFYERYRCFTALATLMRDDYDHKKRKVKPLPSIELLMTCMNDSKYCETVSGGCLTDSLL